MQFEKKEDATNSIEQKVSDSEFIGQGKSGMVRKWIHKHQPLRPSLLTRDIDSFCISKTVKSIDRSREKVLINMLYRYSIFSV
jgi:hypothetical protein